MYWEKIPRREAYERAKKGERVYCIPNRCFVTEYKNPFLLPKIRNDQEFKNLITFFENKRCNCDDGVSVAFYVKGGEK